MILVTGGAGFIGSNFVLDWLAQSDEPVVNLDALTYAGNVHNLRSLEGDPRHIFVHGNIGDATLVADLLSRHRPRAIVNFAAESHVDRSIHGPEDFIQTNILGSFRLLEAVRAYWNGLQDKSAFRFPACVDRRGVRHAWFRVIPHSTKKPAINRTARIPPARPRATIWCAPISTPMACRC
jgi:dTDP-D-glucose 4,6-dehydratase